MSAPAGRGDLKNALAAIEADGEAIPWTERRSIAASLGEPLRFPGDRQVAMELICRLSEDPKWEVRREVASHLYSLPDEDFTRLAVRLTSDPNVFVRTAAESSFERRRRGRPADTIRRGPVIDFLNEVDALEDLHGPRVAGKVQRLAERLFDMTAGSAVHEIRGILTPLKSTATKLREAAAKSDLDASAVHDSLDLMLRRLDMLERFINDMRTYSEPVPIDRTPECVAELVAEANQIARESFVAQDSVVDRVSFEQQVDAKMRLPLARPYFVAAIRNVLANAYDAIGADCERSDPGRITLVAAVTATEMRIEIADNGVGLSAEELRELRAFVPGRFSKGGKGTGFGLPTAQRYIASQGGALSIDSQEGVGTTVKLVLPVEA